MSEEKINCNGECSTCKSSCGPICPKCGAPGKVVPAITVATLSNSQVNLEEEHYLCLRPNCDVAYFTENKKAIDKKDVNTPIWFKSKYEDYIVCYCRNIYLKDIVMAVISLGGTQNKKEILHYLGKEEGAGKCIIKNPTGAPCDELFTNAIIYANNIYNKMKEHQE